MKAPFLLGLGANNVYQSAPGVGAGSPARGFVAEVTCMVQPGGIFTLAANYDNANDRGWRLMAAMNMNGSVQLSAEVGLSDGSTLVQSGWFNGHIGQTIDLLLEVGDEGADASMTTFANGNLLFSGNLGAGLSYAPAAGQPFQIGGMQTAPGVNGGPATGSGALFLGAGFLDPNTDFSLTDAAGIYGTRQQIGRYAPFLTAYGLDPSGDTDVAYATFAWDTQSLLAGGLDWNPAPQSGNELLSYQGDGFNLLRTKEISWWQPVVGTTPPVP